MSILFLDAAVGRRGRRSRLLVIVLGIGAVELLFEDRFWLNGLELGLKVPHVVARGARIAPATRVRHIVVVVIKLIALAKRVRHRRRVNVNADPSEIYRIGGGNSNGDEGFVLWDPWWEKERPQSPDSGRFEDKESGMSKALKDALSANDIKSARALVAADEPVVSRKRGALLK